MSGQRNQPGREPRPAQPGRAPASPTAVRTRPAAQRPTVPQRSTGSQRSTGGAGGRRSRLGRRLLLWAAVAFASFFVVGAALFAYAYATTDIPDPNEGFETQTSYVYYADGKHVLGRFADQNRTSVDLDHVPEHVQNAVIAAEDRSFWTNRGIDPRGILRAAFNNARGGDTQGASTITQQYVKVYYLSQDRTWSRKVREAVLSLKIQRQMDKDEILQGYLNTIYFGRGAYGIEAAARAYFREPAAKLDVREGAVLAAIINSPNSYDPAEGRAAKRALRARYRYVLESMDEMGNLPPRVLRGKHPYRLPEVAPRESESQYGGQRGHVLQMVRSELHRLGYDDAEIDGGGLRITTTFSEDAMAAAQAAVEAERPDLDDLHVAVASVDPKTGALRGMYAGQDYLDSQLNWAVAGGAPGSTFKPFALATGLSYGYSLRSVFDGSSPLEVGGTEFNNQGEGGGSSYGPISLLTATEDSVNTAYVDMVDSMPNGVEQVVDNAVAMGIPRDAPGLDPYLSIVLGSATVSPIDMANAYGTIADGGLAKDVYVVESVRQADGVGNRYRHRLESSRVLSPEVAADTSYALQQVAAVGTGTNANVIGRPVAGKTGTATTDGGHVRSSWFVGYTPQLATAVMYSRGNGNEPLDGYLDTFYGGEHPARTWAGVMSRALEDSPVEAFPEPANLGQRVAGHEPTPTATPTPTASPSPSTPSGSPSPGPSGSAEPSPSQSPSASPSPSSSPSSSPGGDRPGGGSGPGRPPSPGEGPGDGDRGGER